MHEFKSKSLQEKYFEDKTVSSVKNGKAHFLMNFNNGADSMKMFCWWKTLDSDAIIEKLGEINMFFTTECIEMSNVSDAWID